MTQEEVITKAIESLIAEIIARSEAQGQRASGQTYATLQPQNVSGSHGELWGATYIGVLEDGRRPGGVPSDFIETIKEWAAYKGIAISDPVEFEQWAQAVKWKIIREGTKLYRTSEKPDIFTSAVETFKETLKQEFQIYYKTAVEDAIRTAWNKH